MFMSSCTLGVNVLQTVSSSADSTLATELFTESVEEEINMSRIAWV